MSTEEWNRGPGTPPVVTGLVWCTDGSRMEGTRAGIYVQSVGRSLSISLVKYSFLGWDISYLGLWVWNSNDVRPEKYEFALIGCSESPSDCHVSIGTTMSKGVAYLYPAHCGAVLGPWTCWGTRIWNRQQGHKRRFCAKACGISAVRGVL